MGNVDFRRELMQSLVLVPRGPMFIMLVVISNITKALEVAVYLFFKSSPLQNET
jgi:hypothetical protein